jgi:outer membrane immunogenic protein
MKKFLAQGIGLLGLMSGGAAMAADLSTPFYKAPPPPVAVDIWNGFYGGFNAGVGVSRNRTNDTEIAPGIGTGVLGNDAFNHALTGGMFGAQLGWNWHVAPAWLLGLETDAQWSDRSQSSCISACLPGAGFITLLAVTDDQSMKWLSTTRARVGWIAPNGALWYATGGAAWGRVQDTVTLTATPGFFLSGATASAATFSHDKAGWTIGAGVETPLARNWSLKAEYLYVDLGRVTDSFAVALGPSAAPATTQTTTNSYSIHDNIVRVGVNYHFGGPGGAMASAAPAYAAAGPVATPRWTGFYGGLNGGGSLARNSTADTSLVTPGLAFPVFGADTFSHAPFGGIFGGQLGANWQAVPSWVLGVEADLQWSGEKDQACISQCLSAGVPGTFLGLIDQQSIKWLATARGRVGWVAPNGSLWYATGGAAWGRVDQTLTLVATPTFLGGASGAATFGQDRLGWTIGAGVETPVWDHWSVKAEYLYVDLGTVTNAFSAPLDASQLPQTTIATTSASTIHDHIVRFGVNYHFN